MEIFIILGIAVLWALGEEIYHDWKQHKKLEREERENRPSHKIVFNQSFKRLLHWPNLGRWHNFKRQRI